MSKPKLIEFSLKDQGYYGLVKAGNNSENYSKVTFAGRETKITYTVLLNKKSDELYEFYLSLQEIRLQHDLWDVYLCEEGPITTEEPGLRLGHDTHKFSYATGFYALNVVYYETASQVYYPYFTETGKLTIKVAGRRNSRVKTGIISIDDFYVEKDFLRINGIKWPNCTKREAQLVIESMDSRIRITDWVFGSDIFVDLTEWKKRIYEIQGSLRFRIFLEINTGDKIHRLLITYQNGIQKKEVYPLFLEKEEYSGYLEGSMRGENEKENHLVLLSMPNGELRLYYNSYRELFEQALFSCVDQLSMKKNIVSLQGRIESFGFDVAGIRLAFRNNAKEDFIDFPLKEQSQHDKAIHYTAVIDLSKIDFKPYYWDFFVLLKDNSGLIPCRMKQYGEDIKKGINHKLIRWTYQVNSDYLVFPYLTGNDNLSLQFKEKTKYDSTHYKLKETLAVWIFQCLKFYYTRKRPWLICEKFCRTAQDNSYYFFEYCYNNSPKRDIYYIIDKESADYVRVKNKSDKVISFMSLKHMLYLQCNAVLISAESRLHYYAWKAGRGRIRIRLNEHPYVFLQHGVIGLKRLTNIGKNTLNRADLFVTSSEFEKSLVVKEIGYEKNEVIVTGLPRWDAVVDKRNFTKPANIVIMPSWRNWLEGMTNEEFLSSQYYLEYSALLGSDAMKDMLTKYNINATFILHPMLAQYVSNFNSFCSNIQIYQFDKTPINEVLMRTSLLITDYSSVAWEVYRTGKPVVFYRFDSKEYEEDQGSYINLDEEVIGHVTKTQTELLRQIRYYIETGFAEEDRFASERNKYFEYIDNNNSSRVYQFIKKKFL